MRHFVLLLQDPQLVRGRLPSLQPVFSSRPVVLSLIFKTYVVSDKDMVCSFHLMFLNMKKRTFSAEEHVKDCMICFEIELLKTTKGQDRRTSLPWSQPSLQNHSRTITNIVSTCLIS